MRLSQAERSAIVDAVRSLDSKAEVFIFGSRTDDTLKGGDLDLLLISDTLGFSERLTLLVQLKAVLGDQKIDLLIRSPSAARADAFVLSILQKAVRI